jgi:tetratricopeptide (TPR) repeat protein
MAQTDKQKNIDEAFVLYRRIIDLCEANKTLDAASAHWVIRAADDADKLFGTTHQEERVELERLKKRAELVVVPGDFNEARKRSEGFLLDWLWPRNPRVKTALLLVIGIGSLAALFGVSKLFGDRGKVNTNTNAAPISTSTPASPANSPQLSSPTPEPKPSKQTVPTITARAADDRARSLKLRAEQLMNQGKYQEAIDKLNRALAIPGISNEMVAELRRLRLTAITMATHG